LATKAFILGNGPSLKKLDFSLLEGELCFGMNRIHLAYRTTDWRPDVYVAADYAYNPKVYIDASFHIKQGYDVWARPQIIRKAASLSGIRSWTEWSHVHPVIGCGHDLVTRDPATKWHFPHVCCYGGSMHAAIQIAILYYGVDDIILLGCDTEYKTFPPGTPDPNHFHEEYQSGFNPTSVRETNEVQRDTWAIVAAETKARKIKIRDATPSHKVGFPAISLKEVAHGNRTNP
jgi:hypothetical protein